MLSGAGVGVAVAVASAFVSAGPVCASVSPASALAAIAMAITAIIVFASIQCFIYPIPFFCVVPGKPGGLGRTAWRSAPSRSSTGSAAMIRRLRAGAARDRPSARRSATAAAGGRAG